MEEALKIFEQLGEIKGQAQCLNELVWLLLGDGQFDAAEKAALRAVDLLSEKGQEFIVCELHQILGKIYKGKRENKKATHHFETALRLASTCNGHDGPFWIHHDLAEVFRNEGEFDDADAHIQQANSHAIGHAFKRGRVMQMQTKVRFSPTRSSRTNHELRPATKWTQRSSSVRRVHPSFKHCERHLCHSASSSCF